jgi:hypothetical protein
VRTFEESSGARLNAKERIRYARVLGEFEQAAEGSTEFMSGQSMTLDEAVEYALANID